MKKAYLIATMLVLPASSLFAQGQSEIDLLKARIDVQERRISQLESKLMQLAGKTAPAPKAIPVQEKKVVSTGAYEVVKGDTLTRIATKNKTTVAAIKKENGLKGDALNIGQKLRIPSAKVAKQVVKTPVAKKVEAPKPSASKSLKKYTVKAGDTFYGIARRHNISEAKLQASNPKASPSKLQIGQQLFIDASVKSKKASIKKKQVAKEIPVKTATPPVKRKVMASKAKPKSKQVAKAPKKKAASVPVVSKKSTGIRTITVDKPMTYGAFANQYGANTSDLNNLNGLSLSKSTMLAKGSELYIPLN